MDKFNQRKTHGGYKESLAPLHKKRINFLSWLKEDLNVSSKDVSRNLGNGIKATDYCITAIYLGLRFRPKSFNDLLKFTQRCGGDVDT